MPVVKPIVLVVGMNRSGTSLLCQSLARLGVSFGSPLIEGDEANPRGYYEHKDIVHHQTLYMHECCDRHGWDDIGELDLLDEPAKLAKAEWHEEQLRQIVASEVEGCELFGVKTTYWPRIPEVWWNIVDDYEPVFIHAMRHPSQVLHSILKANKTEDKLTDERQHMFLRQWAWHNASLFEFEGTEVWFEDWWPEPEKNMEKLAKAIGREPVSCEGLLL